MKHNHLITVFVIFIFLLLVSYLIGATIQDNKCTDTDPNSRVDTKGVVRIKLSNGTEEIVQDSCPTASSNKVTEVNCDNGEITKNDIDCPNNYVCNDGRCKKN